MPFPRLLIATAAALALAALPTAGLSASALPGGVMAATPSPDDTPTLLAMKGEHETGAEEQNLDKLRDAYYASRLLAGDTPLTLEQAASLRERASKQASAIRSESQMGAPRGGTWTSQGPAPIVQVVRTSNTYAAMSGRIGALVIRNDGTIVLGAAHGGVWTYDDQAGTWTSRTHDADTQAVGALALAPSNDKIVYLGSGEGALSGDSYYGDGIWRSDDGGVTWRHVSDLFTGQATAALAVDPTNPEHVYAATLRGRGGNHRVSAPTAVAYGVYESTDGGATWTLRKGTTDQFHGATDVVMDPQNPMTLWASFWGDQIYKSTDGGRTWAPAMTGMPDGNWDEGATRFALGVSRPQGTAQATLYAGFDYYDKADTYHSAQIYKSVDGGATWALATGAPTRGPDSVVGYCGTQCFYDNVVKPDPADPSTVYALGSYGYGNSPQSGGIYRSVDGGATWVSLGYDLHPDFHAIAFQANDTSHIAVGNDGGVWQSKTGGGRPAGQPLNTVDWQNLNGQVNPRTAALVHSTGLAITQFTSVATVPAVPGQYWGGTQDNGTLRKSLANARWFDQASGDGGQVIVDQTTANRFSTSFPAYVFGTYYGITPYRYALDKVNTFFGNEMIDGGIDTSDRAEFYVPWVQNRANTNQMFLGTYRLYRTNNAEAPSSGDVTWAPISGDLSTGCTGSAPNGARGCFISAVAVADGGDAVWVGTDDAKLWVSPDAVSAATPTWKSVGTGILPNRPVDQIAVDRSNWRIAYVAYGGFGAATPGKPGHVYATTDGGRTFRDASGNLPDVPANSVVIDPSNSSTIYVGTDVGVFVSVDAGRTYSRLGSGMPKVATWQLDYDAKNGILLAGTHGRSAYTLANRDASPALIVSKADSGKPVGPGSTIDYTITVRNIGNADATGVTITDRSPQHTSLVAADQGGQLSAQTLTWRGLTVPAGGTLQVHLSVRIESPLAASVTAIVNDGITVTSSGGVGTTGSPHATPIAHPYGLAVSPATQSGGAKVGTSITYPVHVANLGYRSDSYAVSASGTWPMTVLDASCATPLSTTAVVASGAGVDVCVKVDVPAAAADDARDTGTVTATSVASPAVSGTASITTIAVVSDTVLVDGDGNAPDVSARYKAAMGARAYGYWDLAADPALPTSYITAHKNVVWWTGSSYPAPITPYEPALKALLDGGGRVFLSGQDLLDQAAGTTSFVHDYLHVSWDGTEAQNDKESATVSAVSGNPVTAGLGTLTLDHSLLGAAYEDQITPIDPATAAFTDGNGKPDALTVATAGYKVFFAAFPVEAMGSATDRATLVGNALGWFAQP